MGVKVPAISNCSLVTEEVVRGPRNNVRLAYRNIRAAFRATVCFLGSVCGNVSNKPFPTA